MKTLDPTSSCCSRWYTAKDITKKLSDVTATSRNGKMLKTHIPTACSTPEACLKHNTEGPSSTAPRRPPCPGGKTDDVSATPDRMIVHKHLSKTNVKLCGKCEVCTCPAPESNEICVANRVMPTPTPQEAPRPGKTVKSGKNCYCYCRSRQQSLPYKSPEKSRQQSLPYKRKRKKKIQSIRKELNNSFQTSNR